MGAGGGETGMGNQGQVWVQCVGKVVAWHGMVCDTATERGGGGGARNGIKDGGAATAPATRSQPNPNNCWRCSGYGQ